MADEREDIENDEVETDDVQSDDGFVTDMTPDNDVDNFADYDDTEEVDEVDEDEQWREKFTQGYDELVKPKPDATPQVQTEPRQRNNVNAADVGDRLAPTFNANIFRYKDKDGKSLALPYPAYDGMDHETTSYKEGSVEAMASKFDANPEYVSKYYQKYLDSVSKDDILEYMDEIKRLILEDGMEPEKAVDLIKHSSAYSEAEYGWDDHVDEIVTDIDNESESVDFGDETKYKITPEQKAKLESIGRLTDDYITDDDVIAQIAQREPIQIGDDEYIEVSDEEAEFINNLDDSVIDKDKYKTADDIHKLKPFFEKYYDEEDTGERVTNFIDNIDDIGDDQLNEDALDAISGDFYEMVSDDPKNFVDKVSDIIPSDLEPDDKQKFIINAVSSAISRLPEASTTAFNPTDDYYTIVRYNVDDTDESIRKLIANIANAEGSYIVNESDDGYGFAMFSESNGLSNFVENLNGSGDFEVATFGSSNGVIDEEQQRGLQAMFRVLGNPRVDETSVPASARNVGRSSGSDSVSLDDWNSDMVDVYKYVSKDWMLLRRGANNPDLIDGDTPVYEFVKRGDGELKVGLPPQFWEKLDASNPDEYDADEAEAMLAKREKLAAKKGEPAIKLKKAQKQIDSLMKDVSTMKKRHDKLKGQKKKYEAIKDNANEIIKEFDDLTVGEVYSGDEESITEQIKDLLSEIDTEWMSFREYETDVEDSDFDLTTNEDGERYSIEENATQAEEDYQTLRETYGNYIKDIETYEELYPQALSSVRGKLETVQELIKKRSEYNDQIIENYLEENPGQMDEQELKKLYEDGDKKILFKLRRMLEKLSPKKKSNLSWSMIGKLAFYAHEPIVNMSGKRLR